MELVGLHEHTCKQCGKDFECRTEYVYKLPTNKGDVYHWFCSYKCIQKYREEHKKTKLPRDKDKLILAMLDRGMTQAEVGEYFHMTSQSVGRVKQKWRDWQ